MPRGKYERDHKIPKDHDVVLKDLNELGSVVRLVDLYKVTRSAWEAYLIRHNIRMKKTIIWEIGKREEGVDDHSSI